MRVHPGQIVLIRSCHPHAFRSGEWARIVGVSVVRSRLCFDVEFLDGYIDQWPIEDETAKYEFKPSIRTKCQPEKPTEMPRGLAAELQALSGRHPAT